MNCSKRSFSALHMGQISGGSPLAHKYPQTRHLHIGIEEDDMIPLTELVFNFSRSSDEGLLSGIGFNFFSPFNISPDTYKPQ